MTPNNLTEKRKQLLAELAEIDKQIEADAPFRTDQEYYRPRIDLFSEPCLATSHDWVEEGAMEVNPTGIFMFKTKERCESFNKKLLELAERQATIEYGVVERPEFTIIGDADTGLRMNPDMGRFPDLEISLKDRPFISLFDSGGIKQLRDYCNQCLDYLEQKALRSGNGG